MHFVAERPYSGLENRVVTKGVFSLEEFVKSLSKSLNSLKFLETVGFSFIFRSLGSLQSLESLEDGLF